MPAHPTFSSGHCFMSETLSKQQVEFVGEVLHAHMKHMRDTVSSDEDRSDYAYAVKRVNAIFAKMDYPMLDLPPI